MSYTVRFYTGDYGPRQRAANRDGAICYVEQHFNSTDSASVNYSLSKVADNAGARSKRWGESYAAKVAEAFDISSSGISIGGRGNANLNQTEMPAILLEPFFISNSQGSAWAHSPEKQKLLAEILVATIREQFPAGGLVALSIGHKGKTSSPSDRGAEAVSGGFEADFAELVLKNAAALLTKTVEKPKKPTAQSVPGRVPEGKRPLVGDGTWGQTMRPYVENDDIVMRTVRATYFGDVDDSMDSGTTASGFVLKDHPDFIGVALPMRIAGFAKTKGSPIPRMPYHETRVRVWSQETERSIEAELIDLGPAKGTKNAIDLSLGAVKALGLNPDTGKWLVDVRILTGAHYLDLDGDGKPDKP